MNLPNTTPTPNELYNGELKKMNGTELKVVMIVTRATLGWEINHETGMRKTEDWISYYQLKQKTGCGYTALARAIDKCVKVGWIEIRDKKGNLLDTHNKRVGKKLYYRLGRIFLNKIEVKTTSTERGEVEEPTSPLSVITESVITESEAYKRNPYTKKNSLQKESTPAQDFIKFLNSSNKERINLLEEEFKRKLSSGERDNIEYFISYWTETNHSGMKQRWQLEKTFDFVRRIGTWFRNMDKFGNNFNNDKIKVYKTK